jgi:hypothetical protein
MKARRSEIGRLRVACAEAAVWTTTADGALPQAPGFSEAWLRCSNCKRKASDYLIVRGLVPYRRTVGLAIPCQVASPQSLTPFHQTGTNVAHYENKTLQR